MFLLSNRTFPTNINRIMTITKQFRTEIEDFLSTSGMDPTGFGRSAMNDPNFVFDLRDNRSPTAATMDKVRHWISTYNSEVNRKTSTNSNSGKPFKRHLIGIDDVSPSEITALLDLSDAYVEQNRRDDKKSAVLRGRTIINLFFETSTRTRTSFELAGKRLSGDVINMSVSTSAIKKGETLVDTAMTLTAMHPDVLVVRHPESGSVKLLSEKVNCSVINAGDGSHEHPTQALLDALTIRRRLGRLNNLTVAICGDVLHSRVARSNIYLLQAMGTRVRVVAPPTLLPAEIERFGVEVFTDMTAGLKNCDIVMMLRLQTERMQGSYVPSTREYFRYYGLDREKLAVANPDALVMHPGPMNRGIEIDSELADDIDRSLIRDQVEMGVAVRMACLDLLTRNHQLGNMA